MIDLHRPPTPPQRQHRPTTVRVRNNRSSSSTYRRVWFPFAPRLPPATGAARTLPPASPRVPPSTPLPSSSPRPPSIPSPSTQRRQEPARILHGNQGGATLGSAVSSAPAQKKSSFFCQRFPPLILDARRRRHAGRSARSTPRLPLLASGHPRRPLLR